MVVSAIMCSLYGEPLTSVTGNYHFTYTDPSVDIEEVGRSFMLLRESFSDLCGFDPDPEKYPAQIRILPDRAAFDEYLVSRIGETRSQFVFLKYGRPELSELVLYPSAPGTDYESFAGPSLNRQLFLQYLYSYVLEPPLWLRDGLQAWVETLTIENNTVVQSGYSPWLETAKQYLNDSSHRLPLGSILTALTGTYEAARLYPLSWAAVSFFLQTELAGYQRFIHETFVVLEGQDGYNRRSQDENTRAVYERFERMARLTDADADFMTWIRAQTTFSEMLKEGIGAYTAGRHDAAQNILHKAVQLQPSDPLPAYYLGLSLYAAGNYRDAEKWYRRALENGADAATVHWALALASHASRKYREAREYLEKARELSPARYGDKAAALLKSMPE